ALHPPQLQMQAANGAAGRLRMVVLDEWRRDPVLAEFLGVVGLEKESVDVRKDIRLDNQDAWQRRFDNPHVTVPRARALLRAADIVRTCSTPSSAPAVSGRRARCNPCETRFPRGTRPSTPVAPRSPG